MFRSSNPYRGATLALLGLLAVLLISAIAWAVPGSGGVGNEGGGWVLTPGLECTDSSLYCVVWESNAGTQMFGPCCVSSSELMYNSYTGCNQDFRDDE